MGCMNCHHEHAAVETCAQCEFDAFVRNHFFTGKMMGAAEFETETLYHSDKMRHHNARLHGSGAVCGLRVGEHDSPECRKRYVVVSPGSALDCCGREIIVAQEEIVDVASDPDVAKLRGDGRLHTLQLCVAYRDCPTEDVPVLYDECGCDDTKCAPNRILESFRFDVLVDPPLPAADLIGVAPLGAFVATDEHGLTGFSRASAAGKVLVADPGSAGDAVGPDATKPKRLFILDTRYRSMKTITLGDPARAAALSADGNFVFVLVQSRVRIFKVEDGSEVTPAGANFDLPATIPGALYAAAGAGDNAFLLYDAVNGKVHRWKADTTVSPTNTGLADAAANTVTLSSGANLTGVVANADGSVLYGIAAGKVSQYILSSPGTAKQFTPPVATPVATPSALAAFTLGTTPLVAVASRTAKRVFLVDFSPATPAASATIDLDKAPAFVGAVTEGLSPPDPTAVWLQVLEEESGHLYTQGVSLKPLAAGGTALLGAPRLAADGARAIVLAFPAGQAGVVHPTALADSDCAEHLWKQLDGCPACELPDCVVLATIANYLPDDVLDNARIDNRLGRRVVASTATLQAWLQCLHLKGGIPGPAGPQGPQGPQGPNGLGINGVDAQIVPCEQPPVASFDTTTRIITLRVPRGCDGKDGIGLYTNLPKILDIGWTHGSQWPWADWAKRCLTFHLDPNNPPPTPVTRAEIQQALLTGNVTEVPFFTLYFNRPVQNVDRQSLRVRVDMPFAYSAQRGTLQLFFGAYSPLGHEIFGDIETFDARTIGAQIPTPHTSENAAFAAVFIPSFDYFWLRTTPPTIPVQSFGLFSQITLAAMRDQTFEMPTVTLSLKGEFVHGLTNSNQYSQDLVLDAENIGGRVGRNETRGGVIRGGKNPSGNLAQGGRFESWVFLKPSGDPTNPPNIPPISSHMMQAFMPNLTAGFETAMPRHVNLVDTQTLAALPGVSEALAKRVTRARRERPFSGVSDLRHRAHLTDAEWDKLKDHVVVLPLTSEN